MMIPWLFEEYGRASDKKISLKRDDEDDDMIMLMTIPKTMTRSGILYWEAATS